MLVRYFVDGSPLTEKYGFGVPSRSDYVLYKGVEYMVLSVCYDLSEDVVNVSLERYAPVVVEKEEGCTE